MEFLHLVLLSVSVVFHVPVQGFVEVQKNKKNKKACKIVGLVDGWVIVFKREDKLFGCISPL